MIPKGQSDADMVTGTVLQTLYIQHCFTGYGGQLALHPQDSALCHPDKVWHLFLALVYQRSQPQQTIFTWGSSFAGPGMVREKSD